jgi:hypothetical protein
MALDRGIVFKALDLFLDEIKIIHCEFDKTIYRCRSVSWLFVLGMSQYRYGIGGIGIVTSLIQYSKF